MLIFLIMCSIMMLIIILLMLMGNFLLNVQMDMLVLKGLLHLKSAGMGIMLLMMNAYPVGRECIQIRVKDARYAKLDIYVLKLLLDQTQCIIQLKEDTFAQLGITVKLELIHLHLAHLELIIPYWASPLKTCVYSARKTPTPTPSAIQTVSPAAVQPLQFKEARHVPAPVQTVTT
jgi:hypothetical protein